ncbi:TIGR00282 family metallophosphoesterase [Lentisphaerota bacterium WC36G]|nr:TIGR00282 family metallophosphoesterase [Lentisphaerae bacterium WC36]
MKILIIGDIVGKGGRKAVLSQIPKIKKQYNCEFIIANGENIANGSGLAYKCTRELSETVDVITTGDHIWDQKKFEYEINEFNNVIRPANLSNMQPGKGWDVFTAENGTKIAVINLLGKVFVRDSAYCPFETVEKILNSEKIIGVKNIFVDFHAEATSEKIAMGYFLDGKVTAMVGTHTHVQTADAKILPQQTAYITDLGMVGAEYSVLGRNVEAVVQKFRSGMPMRMPVEESGIRLDAVVVKFDNESGKASSITSLSFMTEI